MYFKLLFIFIYFSLLLGGSPPKTIVCPRPCKASWQRSYQNLSIHNLTSSKSTQWCASCFYTFRNSILTCPTAAKRDRSNFNVTLMWPRCPRTSKKVWSEDFRLLQRTSKHPISTPEVLWHYFDTLFDFHTWSFRLWCDFDTFWAQRHVPEHSRNILKLVPNAPEAQIFLYSLLHIAEGCSTLACTLAEPQYVD